MVVTGEDLLEGLGSAAPAADDADHDALVLFTSGTTGLPKAVGITGRQLSRRIKGMAAPFRADAKPSVGMMCVPFFHVGGALGTLGGLYSGNTSVLQRRFDAGEWLRLVSENRVTTTFLVPTMLQRILDHPDFGDADLSSLVAIAYGPPPRRSVWCAEPWPLSHMWLSPTCSARPRPSAPTRR